MVQNANGRFIDKYQAVIVEENQREDKHLPFKKPRVDKFGFPNTNYSNSVRWKYSVEDESMHRELINSRDIPYTYWDIIATLFSQDGTSLGRVTISLYYNQAGNEIHGYINNQQEREKWYTVKNEANAINAGSPNGGFNFDPRAARAALAGDFVIGTGGRSGGASGTSGTAGNTGTAVGTGLINLGGSTQDDSNNCRDSTELYLYEGQYYTLEQLQQQCDLLPTLRRQYQQASPVDRLRMQQQLVDAERICALISDINSGRYASGAAPTPNTDETVANSQLQTDIYPEDAITDLDAASSNLTFGSSLGVDVSPFLSLGINATVIGRQDYGARTSQLLERFSLEVPLVQDRLKYFFNSFYSLEENDGLTFFRGKSNIIYLLLTNARQQEAAISAENYSYAIQDTLTFTTRVQQNISRFGLITSEDSSQGNEQLKEKLLIGSSFAGKIQHQDENKINFNFSEFVNRNKEAIVDDSFEMVFPLKNSELLKNLNIINPFIIDIKTQYNFYIEKYEQIAASTNLQSHENELPNLYILSNNQNQQTQIQNNNLNEYFENFSIDYINSRQTNSSFYEQLKQKNKNIIFLTDAVKNLSILNDKKDSFPMYTNISIPFDKKNAITNMLNSSELMNNFIINLCNLFINNSFETNEKVISQKLFQQNITDNTLVNPALQINREYFTERKTINQYPLSQIMDEIFAEEQFGSTTQVVDIQNSVVIGDVASEFQNRNNSSMRFVNSLRKIIFLGQIKTFLKNNFRNYVDLLNGKKAYNETVAYRIAKYEKNATGDNPIQNIWIPKVDNLDFVNIIDTQIKYSKEYNYKIFAYQIVASSHYAQELLNYDSRNQLKFDMKVVSRIQPTIMEIEIAKFDNLSLKEHPPLSPEIEFVPYFGKDNKIGLFLNLRTGEEKLEPISILANDDQKINTYVKDTRNLVTYKTDDFAKRFEVMKLDKKPRNYTDFRNGFIKLISPNLNVYEENNFTAGSIIDDVEPNKKYYYCFRTVDVHDNISNPSPVYELEIINENGMIFPIIKIVEFETPKFENSMEMRRFIKIKPQLQHYLIDTQNAAISQSENAEAAIQNIGSLGISNVASPWGKTFKMIATSKQTGKKIEIKFKFDYKLE